jgi:hypothetical protein
LSSGINGEPPREAGRPSELNENLWRILPVSNALALQMLRAENIVFCGTNYKPSAIPARRLDPKIQFS